MPRRAAGVRDGHVGHGPGFSCRELRYAVDGGRKGMARLLLRGDVLVVINAVYDEDEEVARRFLASAR